MALIAHEDRRMLLRAIAAVRAEIEPEPPVLDYRLPPRPDRIRRGSDNVIKSLRIAKGEVVTGFSRAAHIVEGVYETGVQERVHFENRAMAAWLDGESLVVQGSMQGPCYVWKALNHAPSSSTPRSASAGSTTASRTSICPAHTQS